MIRANPKQYFNDVESLYKAQFDHFVKLASRHVYNRDHSMDVVQDAFVKTLEYFKKNPDKKVRPQVMEWQVLKACKRRNKESREIPYEHPYAFKEQTYNEDSL